MYLSSINKPMSKMEYAQKYFCKEYNAYAIDKVETNYVQAYICKRQIKSPLGLDDAAYYYVLHRKSWNSWWASEDKANVGTYERKRELGESMPTKILKNVMTRNPNMCAIVVMVPTNPTMEMGELNSWFCKATAMLDWSNKYGGVYDSDTGVEMIGFPRSIFAPRDPWLWL